MSCGQPCWTCGEPIPESRHRLSILKRVFCSDKCEAGFRPAEANEPQNDGDGVHHVSDGDFGGSQD